MKKKNIILIGILAFSIFPLFFIQRAVASYGYVWIKPDGDLNSKWALEPWGDGDRYVNVREQSEDKYIFIPGWLDLKQSFTVDDVSLPSRYIKNVVMYVYAKNEDADRDIQLSMKIGGQTYTSDIITVSGQSWDWVTYSASKESGCWVDANIDAMQVHVKAFDEDTEDLIMVSRIKVKVYWNTLCL